MEQVRRTFILAILLILCYRVQSQPPQVNVVVAKDGSGHFSKISDAVSAAPNGSSKRYCIQIKEGLYDEYIVVDQKKTNIMFLGYGMDKTIISGSRSDSQGFLTSQTPTVEIYGDGFTAQGITFQNVAGPGSQAVALSAHAMHSAFYQCRFKGYQDTLNTNSGYQFFRECEIIGTVDFIFGDASVVFQNCFIYPRYHGNINTITAQGRDTLTEKTGIVIQNCTITAYSDLRKELKNVRTYLGRPWKQLSRTVVMQSYLGNLIDPKGWLDWDHQPRKPFYLEYNNRGPGAATNNRVSWARRTDNSREAALFTARNFIDGNSWLWKTGFPYYLDLK